MTENLRTASLYINNQLLSRGLLRDGETIDFTNPRNGDGGTAATMGRIIAVVNDLILRRDRDAEHRESLSTTLRTVRAESLRQTNDLKRLQDKHADAARKLALSEASETSLRAQLKTAEATIHKLRDEAARQKVLIAQTRAACANEVRKREKQIEGLKKAVGEAGRARGMGRGGAGVVVVSVAGSPGPAPMTRGGEEEGGNISAAGGAMVAATDGLYDLRSETNAFLAELAKGLSEENENLLGLVRKTMGRLKDMSGWERGEEGEQQMGGAGVAEMAAEIDAILQHLRTILTNPSFVPIEEVVVREDEIHRLRHGWEKMESRWQEAVHLIDGWKRRMQVSGRPVNMEELKMGLRLSPVRVKDVEETAQGLGVGGAIPLRLSAVPEDEEEHLDMGDGGYEEEGGQLHSPSPAGSLHLVPAPGMEDEGYPEDRSDISSIFEDDVEDDFDVDQLDVEEPNIEILEQSIMLDSPPLPLPPQLTPLRDNYAAGNRGGALNHRKQAGDFTTIVEERTSDLRDEAPLPPPHVHIPAPQPSPKKKPSQQQLCAVQPEEDAAPQPSTDLAGSNSSLDSILLVKPLEEPSSGPTRKQPKQPSALAPPPIPPKKERPERRKAAPAPPPKQPVPARKPLRSNPAKPAAKPQSRREQTQARKDSPAAPISAPSTRAVSAASAASALDTTTTTVDTSSTSFTSNPPPPPPKPASSSTDTAMMPPPPLPPSKLPDPFSTSSELTKSPKRAGGNSRLPLPRPGSNSNLRGDAIAAGQQLNLLPPPQQSPLSMATIAAKLAASEREADAARVRAKLKAARMGGAKRVSLAAAAVGGVPTEGESSSAGNSRPGSALSAAAAAEGKRKVVLTERGGEEEEEDELAADVKTVSAGTAGGVPTPRRKTTKQQVQVQVPVGQDGGEQSVPEQVQRRVKREKRTAGGVVVSTAGGVRVTSSSSSRRASRRRSTLNPWELETLIQGGVAAVDGES